MDEIVDTYIKTKTQLVEKPIQTIKLEKKYTHTTNDGPRFLILPSFFTSPKKLQLFGVSKPLQDKITKLYTKYNPNAFFETMYTTDKSNGDIVMKIPRYALHYITNISGAPGMILKSIMQRRDEDLISPIQLGNTKHETTLFDYRKECALKKRGLVNYLYSIPYIPLGIATCISNTVLCRKTDPMILNFLLPYCPGIYARFETNSHLDKTKIKMYMQGGWITSGMKRYLGSQTTYIDKHNIYAGGTMWNPTDPFYPFYPSRGVDV